MKKILLILGVCLLIFQTACTHKNYEEAQNCYSSKNYIRVVDLLANAKDEESKALYTLAKARLELENKNYDKVISLLKNTKSNEGKDVLNTAYLYGYSELIVENINNKEHNKMLKNSKFIYKQLEQSKHIEKFEKEFEINYIELLNELNYEDFKFLEEECDYFKKNDKKNQFYLLLNKIKEDNITVKAKAFLQREWVRIDGTNLTNMYIKVEFDNKNHAEITKITDKAKSYHGFAKKDIKWKDIKILDENNFIFKNLSKGDNSSSYHDTKGIIDYKNEKVICHVTAENKTYAQGNNQKFYTIDYAKKIDSVKKLGSDDFKVKLSGYDKKDLGKVLKSSNNNFIKYFEKHPDDDCIINYLDKKLNKEKDLITERNIHYNSKMEEVFRQYGSAYVYPINYFDDEGVNSLIKKYVKRAENYVSYKYKKYQLNFYFDGDEKVSAIVFYRE